MWLAHDNLGHLLDIWECLKIEIDVLIRDAARQ